MFAIYTFLKSVQLCQMGISGIVAGKDVYLEIPGFFKA
jgi:hypothetical protein